MAETIANFLGDILFSICLIKVFLPFNALLSYFVINSDEPMNPNSLGLNIPSII